MDHYLKELCMEVINQDINSEKFVALLVETGVRLESLEWDMANKILVKGDQINSLLQYNRYSVQ